VVDRWSHVVWEVSVPCRRVPTGRSCAKGGSSFSAGPRSREPETCGYENGLAMQVKGTTSAGTGSAVDSPCAWRHVKTSPPVPRGRSLGVGGAEHEQSQEWEAPSAAPSWRTSHAARRPVVTAWSSSVWLPASSVVRPRTLPRHCHGHDGRMSVVECPGGNGSRARP
jgi:hypothetical protein